MCQPYPFTLLLTLPGAGFSYSIAHAQTVIECRALLSGNAQEAIDPSLYRGDLLTDFYEEWILEEREQYRRLFINALLQSARSLRSEGEYERAITLAQKIISIETLLFHPESRARG